MTDKGILLGNVKITLYEKHKFLIFNTFNSSGHIIDGEFIFLLFMIDRVLYEVEELKHKHNFAAVASRYMSDLKNGRSELGYFFNNYKRTKSENLNIVFEVNHELLNKPKMDKEHLYIWTEYSIPYVNNFDGKLTIAAMLYIIDLMNRLDKDDQEFCAKAYRAMLEIYLDTHFPILETIRLVPSIIINKILKS